jgi:hypothetical protein
MVVLLLCPVTINSGRVLPSNGGQMKLRVTVLPLLCPVTPVDSSQVLLIHAVKRRSNEVKSHAVLLTMAAAVATATAAAVGAGAIRPCWRWLLCCCYSSSSIGIGT